VNRYDIINFLGQKYNFQTYVEIGVSDPDACYNRVTIPGKIGVDPRPQKVAPGVRLEPSDQFFRGLTPEQRYSMFFVDGLHVDFQVIRDVENSLAHLEDGGIIMMHDCLPDEPRKATETPHPEQPSWYGTCWKAFMHFRMHYSNLWMGVVDTDCGCGIVKRGRQDKAPWVPHSGLTWDYYLTARKKYMNIISPGDIGQIL
jgi:hypothetical protein